MKISKHAFMIAATGLILGLAFDPMASLAQGGDNPVPGIDVIVKEASLPPVQLEETHSEASTLLCCGGMAPPEMEPIIIEAH